VTAVADDVERRGLESPNRFAPQGVTSHADDAGFDIEQIERFPFAPAFPMRLTALHVLGRARR
jgi:hypothetical protein